MSTAYPTPWGSHLAGSPWAVGHPPGPRGRLLRVSAAAPQLLLRPPAERRTGLDLPEHAGLDLQQTGHGGRPAGPEGSHGSRVASATLPSSHMEQLLNEPKPHRSYVPGNNLLMGQEEGAPRGAVAGGRPWHQCDHQRQGVRRAEAPPTPYPGLCWAPRGPRGPLLSLGLYAFKSPSPNGRCLQGGFGDWMRL